MSVIRKALLFTVLTQHSMQIINLIFTVIMARIITPAELGVYAIASSVSILAMELRSIGVGQYLIREESINDAKIRSATGVMLLISGGLGGIIFLTAPFVSDFYEEEALTVLLRIITATFILAPFTTVPNALLTREMKFQQLFVVRFLSTLVLSTSTIILVLMGFSYYGMAMGILIGALTEFAAVNYYRPKGAPWLPSFSRLGGLIRFGMYISTSQLFVRFSESISDLVIGRIGTMSDVGLFSRGFGFILFLDRLIVKAVGPVILPYLSSIKREGGSVGEAYLKIILLQSAFSIPVFAVVNVAAYPVVRFLFGEQWDAAIPIASSLAIWAIFQAVHNSSTSALISLGKEKIMFAAALTIFITRIAAITFAAMAYIPFNLEAIAWAISASGFIEFSIKTWTVHKAMTLRISNLIMAIIPNCIVAIFCWGAAMLISHFMPYEQTEDWLSITILAGSMPIIWLAALRLTNHELWKIIKKPVSDVIKQRS